MPRHGPRAAALQAESQQGRQEGAMVEACNARQSSNRIEPLLGHYLPGTRNKPRLHHRPAAHEQNLSKARRTHPTGSRSARRTRHTRSAWGRAAPGCPTPPRRGRWKSRAPPASPSPAPRCGATPAAQSLHAGRGSGRSTAGQRLAPAKSAAAVAGQLQDGSVALPATSTVREPATQSPCLRPARHLSNAIYAAPLRPAAAHPPGLLHSSSSCAWYLESAKK